VLVKITGSPGTVDLLTENVTGALSGALNITVQELQVTSPTPDPVLYTGPLASFPPSLPLQNSAGGTTWATNEQHNFVITVDLPLDTDNALQGASGAFDLTWGRS
jgi:hypothetical protein